MKRNKHPLSHYVLSTFDMGQLIPVANYEVLPGDSIRMSTSCLLRVSPLQTPVMHPVTVRIHHWFVAYRLLWPNPDGFEDFITGGPTGESVGGVPSFDINDLATSTLADRFGIPPTAAAPPGTILVNKFPFRAYNKIWNEFYRDQDLQAVVGEDQLAVLNCCWEKDYFTSARPWTQKGPEVSLPLGDFAPITGLGFGAPGSIPPYAPGTPPGYHETGGNVTAYASTYPFEQTNANFSFVEEDPDNPGFPRIRADLGAATGALVSDVRRAFAIQRYAEARAAYGSRYTEYLRYLGVRSSDARLNRPEYLGGGRSTIAFSEVLKTGEGDTPDADAPIGEMRGHGISAMRSRSWTRFFEEHGVVISLASVRPRTLYSSGLHRQHSRAFKEDFWQRELELIGSQDLHNREVYTGHADPAGIFGYQDRYAEYRHHPSYVTGDFRTTLNDWHLGRIFASDPALNADFVNCVPSKRVHAVQTEDVLWGMFSHSIQARRMVTNKVIGRLF